MASDVVDIAKAGSISAQDLSSGIDAGAKLAGASDRLESLKLQNQQAKMDIADKQLSGSLSMANTYLRANDKVRKQMGPQLRERAQRNGAPIDGLLDAFDSDPTLGRQWLIASQQPGFDEKIRANPFLANQIAASDDVMGVINHTQEFLKTAQGEQAASKAVEVAQIKGEYAGQNAALKREADAAKADAATAKADKKTADGVEQKLRQGRGEPVFQQAQKDIYAADKFAALTNLYGDPNKLNPAQVQLAASEVAKIAQGGVPTESEMKHLTPQSIPGKLASIAQIFTNNPTPANQGAFINAMSDYTKSLKHDASKVIADRNATILDDAKSALSDERYNRLKAAHVDKYAAETAAPSAPPAAKNYSAYIKAARTGAGGNPPLTDAQIKNNLVKLYGATAEQADAQLGSK